MDQLRSKIDLIDEQIVSLLNDRLLVSMSIGEAKRNADTNFKVYVPEREQVVMEKVINLNKKGKQLMTVDALTGIYREIISASIAIQKSDITVAFLYSPFLFPLKYRGPLGTYSNQAALNRFGSSVKYIESSSISDVFDSVEKKRANFGVVPIENSIVGSINETFDRLTYSSVGILSETYLEINHALLSKSDSIDKIKIIYSHPEAINQCKIFLGTLNSQVKIQGVESTAKGAEMASINHEAAAICSKFCIDVIDKDLNILAESIQNVTGNATRFAVIGESNEVVRKQILPIDRSPLIPPVKYKTMLLLQVDNFRQSGSLCDVLSVFKEFNINLTNIVSRPNKSMSHDRRISNNQGGNRDIVNSGVSSWEYIWYIELEGHAKEDLNVKSSITKLSSLCKEIQWLGSFPVGRLV